MAGTVRQRGEEFLPEDLTYQREVSHQDPETGEQMVIKVDGRARADERVDFSG